MIHRFELLFFWVDEELILKKVKEARNNDQILLKENVSFEEITLGNKLKIGTYGPVYEATWKGYSNRVLVKIIERDKTANIERLYCEWVVAGNFFHP